jgi:ribosomal-protein-alanine N-acetyltransferase
MTIKSVSAAQAEPLSALHARCFAKAWDAKTFAELMAQPPVFALASTGGFILARVAGGESEILTLAVLPDARRQGLGSQLVRAAAVRAHAAGAETMFLEVGLENLAARLLYQSLGFYKVSQRKAYYPNGEDALVLKASLPLSVLGKTG